MIFLKQLGEVSPIVAAYVLNTPTAIALHALKRDAETAEGYFARESINETNLQQIKKGLDYSNTEGFIVAGADTITYGLGSGITALQGALGNSILTGAKVAVNTGAYVTGVYAQNKVMSEIDGIDYFSDLKNPEVLKKLARDIAVNSLIIISGDVISYKISTPISTSTETSIIDDDIPNMDFSFIPEEEIEIQTNLVDEAIKKGEDLVDNINTGVSSISEEMIWKDTYAPEGRGNFEGIVD